MNDGQLLTVDMLRLVYKSGCIERLLLIKHICATPDEEQCWSKAIKCNNGETMWSMIVQEASKADGNIFLQ